MQMNHRRRRRCVVVLWKDGFYKRRIKEWVQSERLLLNISAFEKPDWADS
jgi:hypothetical protein